MDYQLDDAVTVLRRTPQVLRALLEGLPDRWTTANEGDGTWTPYDVVGHLIHADRTDWISRVEHLLRHGSGVPFPSFDREGMFEASRGRSLAELLDSFDEVRTESLNQLAALQLAPADLERVGRHPEFGEVRLRQHLATWVAHDAHQPDRSSHGEAVLRGGRAVAGVSLDTALRRIWQSR